MTVVHKVSSVAELDGWMLECMRVTPESAFFEMRRGAELRMFFTSDETLAREILNAHSALLDMRDGDGRVWFQRRVIG